MHNILAVVDKTAQQQQATKVTRIDLTIGVRAGVVADALTFAFEAMSPHTLAAGAELVITEIQLCFRCPGCGLESTENQELCPACHLFFEVVRGRELQITSIEIE